MKSLLLNNQIFSKKYLQYKASCKATKNIYFIQKFNNESFKSYYCCPKGYVFFDSIYNTNNMNFNIPNYLSQIVTFSEQIIAPYFAKITSNHVEYLIKSKPNKIINLASKSKSPKKTQKQSSLLVNIINSLCNKICLTKKFIKRIINFLITGKKLIMNVILKN